jgi:membrane-bound metal-dependent hydrolase YbcI (DUF457 family)
MITYKIGRIIARKAMNVIKTLSTLAIFFFIMVKAPESVIRFLGAGIYIGALFHCVGDAFSLGSIPFVYPIPVKKQAYWRPHIPGQIETAGLANKILDIALLVADLFGLYYINFVLHK